MTALARSLLRALRLAAWTSWCALAAAAGSWWWRRESDRRWAWRHRWTQRWGAGCWPILGLTATIEGEPPRPPYLLVANHVSWVDVLLLAGAVPGVFVAKADLAGWPFVGAACRSAGTIFVVRESRRDIVRVNEEVERAVAAGAGVILFAEGTSSSGARVEPFRTALLEYPARAGLPVHWAALSYATPTGQPPARLAVCWWGGMRFLPHVFGLLRLPEFSAGLRLGREPVRESDRKLLASRLHEAVSARFQPIREEDDAACPAVPS
ncbi:MAG: lysophospholipid acyltransferase family protein [Thermoanaerobaculia bacterium]